MSGRRAGEADYPLEVVYRSESVYVKINPRWRPGNPGSALVMPVDHYENIFDLPDTLAAPIQGTARSLGVTDRRISGRWFCMVWRRQPDSAERQEGAAH